MIRNFTYYENEEWIPVPFKKYNCIPYCIQVSTDENSILISLNFNSEDVKLYFSGLSFLSSRIIRSCDAIKTESTLPLKRNVWMFKSSKSHYIEWFKHSYPAQPINSIYHYHILTSAINIEILSTAEYKLL